MIHWSIGLVTSSCWIADPHSQHFQAALSNCTGWGPQDSVQLPYKWLNSMVYGRYNELVNGGYHGLGFEPTNIINWGAPSCSGHWFIICFLVKSDGRRSSP